MIENYANPKRFDDLAQRLLPLCVVLTCILFSFGVYLALFASPPDYQQKETVRIMYVHVPAAWYAMAIFLGMGINSFFVIWRRHHLANIASKVMAPIGAVLCLICLLTGSLWGRPTWGTYWIWDARLTSMLILFFIYLGYSLVHFLTDDSLKAAKISAIFCLIGLIDLPIIKFSVEWWNTLHQGPSVLKAGGPSIHSSMLWPLLTMAGGFLMLSTSLILIGIRTEIMQQKIERIIRKAAKGCEHA